MITPIAEKNSLEEILQNIFDSYNPFEPIIRDSAYIGAVLFPTDSYHLTRKQFLSLIKTLKMQKETDFYISEIEWQPNPFIKGNHWLCSSPTFDEYTYLPIGVENAIYSPIGKWAILISHELFGLLVCKEDFWSKFNENYPDWKKDKQEFLNYWEEVRAKGHPTDWLPKFISILTAV